MSERRVLIMGAAGRDFHDFNVCYRDEPAFRVVAFTATQIPGIADRRYPASLAGSLYPEGIPIYPESELEAICARESVDEVVFAYSDVPYASVMHAAARALVAGADFTLLGPRSTMLAGKRPVLAVGATRTGAGKSQTSRYLAAILERHGLRVAVIRHPMPYGDLAAQRVQRYATYADLDRYQTTIEEREEYEPHLDAGRLLFAGVDYADILSAAEAECDVVLWDGGNNDFPFYLPDLFVVVADPLRVGDELAYHPGETNLRLANVIIINKVDEASPEQLAKLRANIAAFNPGAQLVEAASKVTVDSDIAGLRVAVVEDGPTLTHGGMNYGAGIVAARRFGAIPVDPRPYGVGSIADVLAKYPDHAALIPAMGYSDAQIADLAATLAAMPIDAVLSASPIDLTRVLSVPVPIVRVRYELEPVAGANLEALLSPFWTTDVEAAGIDNRGGA